jgi:hypothetical protein
MNENEEEIESLNTPLDSDDASDLEDASGGSNGLTVCGADCPTLG